MFDAEVVQTYCVGLIGVVVVPLLIALFRRPTGWIMPFARYALGHIDLIDIVMAVYSHQLYAAVCDETDETCIACAMRDCPRREPLHYHHDGCPACDNQDVIPAA